jgi:aspartate kinase
MEKITVHKFGGASVKDASSVRNMGELVSSIPGRKIIIVSAMGKTTNALEQIIDLRWRNHPFHAEVEAIHDLHHSIASELKLQFNSWLHVFLELKTTLESLKSNVYDEVYDQIIGFGELLSTQIVSEYLNQINIENSWIDSAQFIKTDNRFRDARVNWEASQQAFLNLPKSHTLVAQGFIGSTMNNQRTSLGREGSDFSAAIAAYLCNAESVTIWKDVPGLLNGDPKCFTPTKLLEEISFREAVELAYYGASVIHPRTVKPLQNKNIPLFIKSFINPEGKGTIIHDKESNDRSVSSYILKQNQTLISIATKDFSFVVEDNLTEIFSAFSQLGIHVHMMENSALNFSACVACSEEKIKALIEHLPNFNVRYNTNLAILTVRHPNKMVVDQLLQHKEILLEQRNRGTARYVVRGNWILPEQVKV